MPDDVKVEIPKPRHFASSELESALVIAECEYLVFEKGLTLKAASLETSARLEDGAWKSEKAQTLLAKK